MKESNGLQKENTEVLPSRSPMESRSNSKKFLTVAEVAVILRVSEMTVRRLCKARALPHIRVGSLYRILPDFKKSLEAQCTE